MQGKISAAVTVAFWFVLLAPLLFPVRSMALGQPSYVETRSAPGSFRLVYEGTAANLCVDAGDYLGVVRAGHDLQADIFRVSGCNAMI